METTGRIATPYGATQGEWDMFLGLGLRDDLLPVVSNPGAKISPHSKMVGIGKTPSMYNGLGMVSGLPNWTEKTVTDAQVRNWRKSEDYGVCIQTRLVRGVDIDVPDRALAAEISQAVLDLAGCWLPRRSRANSGKCLYGFRMAGEHPKRIITVREKVVDEAGKTVEAAWLIEFLGNGQQFIAAGTHPSGARYDWNFDPIVGDEDFPELDGAVFTAMWEALTERFGLGDSVSLTSGKRKRGERAEVDDPIALLIEEKGIALGFGKDGQIFIDCPWKDGHSGDTGIAQTAYFPKGTRGYEQGHFKCFHASCAARGDNDFDRALELTVESFEVLPPEEDPRTGEERMPMPALLRNSNDGSIKAIAHNTLAILERPDITGLRIRYDTFRDEIMWSPYGKANWMAFSDEHNTELRARFDRIGFKPVGKDLMRDCVDHVAKANRFDSAVEWLERLRWDGVPRVETFASRYLGAEDTPYTRAVANYLWTALAGRVMEPGIKADMAPILVGAQGARKSSAVQAMSPHTDFFTEIDLGHAQGDLARQMRGKLVGEIAELQGLRTRELESIKAFMARQVEEWVPKYKEFTANYARRLVFLGTSNHDDFLADETGDRRWLPFKVTKCDPDAIRRDRDQLWAEGRSMFEIEGLDHITAERLARHEHGNFRAVDAWEDVVARWLADEDMDGAANGDAEYHRNADILQGALNIGADRMKRLDEVRLGSVMPSLGYKRVFRRIDGKMTRVWVNKERADA